VFNNRTGLDLVLARDDPSPHHPCKPTRKDKIRVSSPKDSAKESINQQFLDLVHSCNLVQKLDHATWLLNPFGNPWKSSDRWRREIMGGGMHLLQDCYIVTSWPTPIQYRGMKVDHRDSLPLFWIGVFWGLDSIQNCRLCGNIYGVNGSRTSEVWSRIYGFGIAFLFQVLILWLDFQWDLVVWLGLERLPMPRMRMMNTAQCFWVLVRFGIVAFVAILSQWTTELEVLSRIGFGIALFQVLLRLDFQLDLGLERHPMPRMMNSVHGIERSSSIMS
jgi:hypothetical protein